MGVSVKNESACIFQFKYFVQIRVRMEGMCPDMGLPKGPEVSHPLTSQQRTGT